MENKSIKFEKIDGSDVSAGGGHYNPFTIRIKENVSLRFNGMSVGCGIMQCQNVKSLNQLNDEELAQVKDFLKNKLTTLDKYFKSFGIIVATLGPEGKFKDYKEEGLLKAGFEKMCDYSNWYDDVDGNWIARLYVLRTNCGGKENKGK